MDNYNALAQDYKEYGRHAVTDWVLGYHKVYALIAPIIDISILDVGCGDGKFSRYLAGRGAYVTGIDTSETMIDIAGSCSEHDPHLRYLYTPDRASLQPLKESFDIITANFVSCTIPTKQGLFEFFTDMYQLLDTHGRIMIMNANWEQGNGKEFISYRMGTYDQLTSGMGVEVYLKGPHLITLRDTYWSKEDYTEVLQQAGFSQIVYIEPVALDDSYHWKDEKRYSPILIISAIK